MEKVISQDGTPIAIEKSGEGPAVILVAGAMGRASDPMFTRLAELLAPHFTAYNYDRRGRGESGDTLPYAVEREVEDIDAIINDASGSAYLYGLSSGATLALEAANKLPTKVKKLAMYEPPFLVDNSRPLLPEDYVPHLNELIAEGRRGEAVEYFLSVAILVPADYISQIKRDPSWADMEAMAHTLAYDGTIMGDNMAGNPLPRGRWDAAAMSTLVMAGGDSPPFFHNGAKELVGILPNAQFRVLPGQTHGIDSDVLAPVLIEFFTEN
jgi:pimeloyl-ACP methyl ester carboxylesterase